MTETPEQRKARLAEQAVDGAKAAIEYRQKTNATLRRTAELRAQRLARESGEKGEAKAEKPEKAVKASPKRRAASAG